METCLDARAVHEAGRGSGPWECKGAGCAHVLRPASELFVCGACGTVRRAARDALKLAQRRAIGSHAARHSELAPLRCAHVVSRAAADHPEIRSGETLEGVHA